MKESQPNLIFIGHVIQIPTTEIAFVRIILLDVSTKFSHFPNEVVMNIVGTVFHQEVYTFTQLFFRKRASFRSIVVCDCSFLQVDL
jgi:hypothetical protein